jgi:hypothetical protein
MKAAIIENPYISLCTPPVLIVLQFVVAMALFNNGLPQSAAMPHAPAALLLTAFFALSLPSFPAMLLGIRHVIYGSNKVAPALGIAFNGIYLFGFLVFFVLFFVVKTTA